MLVWIVLLRVIINTTVSNKSIATFAMPGTNVTTGTSQCMERVKNDRLTTVLSYMSLLSNYNKLGKDVQHILLMDERHTTRLNFKYRFSPCYSCNILRLYFALECEYILATGSFSLTVDATRVIMNNIPRGTKVSFLFSQMAYVLRDKMACMVHSIPIYEE